MPPKRQTLASPYEDASVLADRFRQRVVEQIAEILSAAQVALAVPIESRVKAWPSVSAKLKSKELKFKSVTELSDFVGIRLVLLFRRDVARCCEAITKAFQVVASEDTGERLGETEFGYQSVHYQIQIPESWQQIPTFMGFEGLTAEVQIRMAAQHIWAAASHLLQYKNEASVPAPVRRAIHRASALLETVDLEFERVLSEREDYREILKSQEQDTPLNVDSLRNLLDEELPAQNKVDGEGYSSLLDDLIGCGIETTSKVRSVIRKHLSTVMKADKRIASELMKDKTLEDEAQCCIAGQNYGGSKARASKGIFYTHAGIARAIIEEETGKRLIRKREQNAKK